MLANPEFVAKVSWLLAQKQQQQQQQRKRALLCTHGTYSSAAASARCASSRSLRLAWYLSESLMANCDVRCSSCCSKALGWAGIAAAVRRVAAKTSRTVLSTSEAGMAVARCSDGPTRWCVRSLSPALVITSTRSPRQRMPSSHSQWCCSSRGSMPTGWLGHSPTREAVAPRAPLPCCRLPGAVSWVVSFPACLRALERANLETGAMAQTFLLCQAAACRAVRLCSLPTLSTYPLNIHMYDGVACCAGTAHIGSWFHTSQSHALVALWSFSQNSVLNLIATPRHHLLTPKPSTLTNLLPPASFPSAVSFVLQLAAFQLRSCESALPQREPFFQHGTLLREPDMSKHE